MHQHKDSGHHFLALIQQLGKTEYKASLVQTASISQWKEIILFEISFHCIYLEISFNLITLRTIIVLLFSCIKLLGRLAVLTSLNQCTFIFLVTNLIWWVWYPNLDPGYTSPIEWIQVVNWIRCVLPNLRQIFFLVTSIGKHEVHSKRFTLDLSSLFLCLYE